MADYTTIDNPELYFQVKKYTGNSGTQSITLDGDEDMQPDFVWIKARSDAGNHAVYDSVRGATKRITSEGTDAESTVSDGLTAFNSDGFSLGAGGNENSATSIVAWCWKESNSDAGFDILTYTGTQSTQNVSHNLSAVPHVIIIKDRNNAENFFVYHQSTGNTGGLFLNTTGAFVDNAGYYNDTSPTSSVFTVQDTGGVNHDTTSNGHVAYLWSEKQGFSKFGSYKGNSSTDGVFVYLGFRPAFVMIKATSGGEGWYMVDNKRQGFNPENEELFAQSNGAEGTSNRIDLLSNGFKLRDNNSLVNASAITSYIYIAFAEAPFVNSEGVPCNAR